MMFVCAVVLGGMQDPDLAAVLADEARRATVVARCSAAVCSVMSMDSPGGGSGVVFDPSGFVLTNYHVVGEADDDYKLPAPPAVPEAELAKFRAASPDASDDEVARFVAAWQAEWRDDHLPHGSGHYRNKKVGLPDGLLYEAEVLGIDPGSDLAVLRLLPKQPGQRWASCTFGDSDQLLVGETVFAMGNPFLLATDFTPTVTFGIVSGTHRYQEGAGQRMLVYPDCIQVDAPVNPGNSGGPLFNEAGEIVGINGRISIGDRGRVNVGVGFAIASNQIKNFLGDLMAGRHAEHGTLDMSAWFMNSGTGAAQRRGVFVQQLFRDSIVAAAGISLGDEITRFCDVEVRSANQLATMVGVLPAGSWVTVRYRPSQGDGAFGDERRVTVRLARLDTGSSRDGVGADARLASRANRRLAARALQKRFQKRGEGDQAVGWLRTAPDGSTVRCISHGERLRLEIGALTLVREAAGAGHAVEGGSARALSPEEAERLRREWTCNPLLWQGEAIGDRLQDAELVGGVYVFGAPAFRLALPGDGECEAWLFDDGSPAGYVFRDPLRRAKLEWHVRGQDLRVVVDGAIEPGWSAGKTSAVAVDEAWFRRN
ncbi:MAG TPA: trypsin-like peptidase domain-containing protein [Planctomycetota bacterium]|nr:trypsin-like peptidase domain-containing protein [Planctomycetota bacterium]